MITNSISQMHKHAMFACTAANVLLNYFNHETVYERHFIAGETICSPSMEQTEVGLLIDGIALVNAGSGCENALLKSISPGEIFGIANLYTEGAPFPSIITAKEDCNVLMIRSDAFKRYIEFEAEARRAYLSFLSNKIVYLNQKIAIFTAGSAEKRLAFFLLENEENGIWNATCSMGTLADLLGIGRASLYRALDSLTAAGLIVRSDKQIRIPNRIALEEYLNHTSPSF